MSERERERERERGGGRGGRTVDRFNLLKGSKFSGAPFSSIVTTDNIILSESRRAREKSRIDMNVQAIVTLQSRSFEILKSQSKG